MKKLFLTFIFLLLTPTIFAQLVNPTISPAAGNYGTAQTITISGPSGASICYTKDGTTPQASTAGVCLGGSTQTYSGAFSLVGSSTITALTTESGQTNSSIASSAYIITPSIVQQKSLDCSAGCVSPTTITPTIATTAGHMLIVGYSGNVAPMAIKCGTTTTLLSTAAGTNSGTGAVFIDLRYALNVPSTSSCVITTPTGTWTGAANLYEVVATTVDRSCGFIQSTNDGYYPGKCISNTSASVSTGAVTTPSTSDGTTPINTAQPNEYGFSALSGYPSTPTIAAPYTNTDYIDTAANVTFNSGPITTSGSTYMLNATWASGSSMPTGVVLTVYGYPLQPTAIMPILSPTGGRYGVGQSVSIISPTNGSSVYYSTTTTPTCTGVGTLYTGTAISAPGSSTTIQAIACAAGSTPSAVNSHTYIITGRTTPQTWYIRPDGGTRYSPDVTYGQCNGMYDVSLATALAANPGVTTNLPCAFYDFRYLYDSQNYQGYLYGWVIQGGDTVIVRGCHTESNSTAPTCRVGWDVGDTSGGNTWCIGYSNGGCQAPIPSGTSSQPTQIFGQNYASCTDGTLAVSGNQSRIVSGFGNYVALALNNAQHVNVECLELTTYANCVWFGSTNPCNKGYPLSDYSAAGITTNQSTHDVLIQDTFIHGFSSRGIQGSIGGIVTCLRCLISTNASAGWDFDDGSDSQPNESGVIGSPTAMNGNASVNGVWSFNYSRVELSGCSELYPTNGFLPTYCFGQLEGGYGGNTGDAPGGCVTVNVDHSSFYFSIQDNLNWGHADAGPSGAGYSDQGSCAETVTNSYAFGNFGSAWKIGPNMSPLVMLDNVTIGNCARGTAPYPGIPATWTEYLQSIEFCRAVGSPISYNFHAGDTYTISNNTFVSYSPTFYGADCWEGAYYCPESTLNFQNNISYGIQSPYIINGGGDGSYNGDSGGTGGFYWGNGSAGAVVATLNRSYNQWFGIRDAGCPSPGFTGDICSDPAFYNEPSAANGANCMGTITDCTFTEPVWDVFLPNPSASYYLTSTSPALHAGTTYTGQPTTLFDNTAMTSPPPIGALTDNWVAPSLSTITVTPTSTTITTGATTQFLASCLYSNNATTPCNVAWTDTSGYSSINSTTGVVTGTSVGTDTVTATISTLYGTATVIVGAPAAFLPMQGLLLYGRHN